MHVLVTGLEGFTGRYLKDSLEEQGHSVSGLSGDITDIDVVTAEVEALQPEAVVHLAGIAFVGHDAAHELYRVNLVGTCNLLDALQQCLVQPRCVLLVSSANVYGNRCEGLLQETMTPDPVNDYALSKYAMERMAKMRIERLPIVIARPFNYTGVGQEEKFVIPKIVAHFRKKKSFIELGNLDIWREYGDVRAIVKAYTRLLERCPVGKTVNVCCGRTYSLREIVRYCEIITGRLIEIRVNPALVRSNEVRVLQGDNGFLNSLIGEWYVPSIEETLKWMLESSTGSYAHDDKHIG